MRIHDPMHVAQLASLLLSSHGWPEKHQVKKAVDAAVMVLDEAIQRAEEDEAKAAAAEQDAKDEAEKPTETAEGAAKS